MDLDAYRDMLIAVADDCPVTTGIVPTPRGGKPTVAVLQYELLSTQPGTLTQRDVLFQTWLRQQNLPDDLPETERATLWERFFATPRACLRSSPLPKKYGWGLLFDAHGRITLCPMESNDYQRIIAGEVPGVTVRKALRSRRA